MDLFQLSYSPMSLLNVPVMHFKAQDLKVPHDHRAAALMANYTCAHLH